MNTPLVAALNRTADRPAAAPPPGEAEAQGSDWGMAPEKTGMSRENKFILFVLLVLVAVFSFVVFRNFQKKGTKEELAQTTTEKGEANKGDPESTSDGKKEKETEESSGTESAKISKKKKKSEDLADPPAQDEPPQLTTDMFEEGAEKPVKITSHRTGKHHGHDQNKAAVTETETTEELRDPEAKEEVGTASSEQKTEFETERTSRRAAKAVEQDDLEMTPATSPRRAHAAAQVQEDAEGSAEPVEVQQETAQSELPRSEKNEFAETRAFDASVEQTAGTEEKGPQLHIKKKTQVPVAETNELAQAGVPMVPDEMGTGTTPHRAPSHRTGTGNRVSGPPSARAQHAAGLPRTPNEDKFGGLQPEDVTRRPPAPRGNFDPQADPLVNNTGEYVIRPNDNYWRISRKVYGTPRYFEALRKHNEQTISDPKNLKVGTRIATPSIELLEQEYKDILPVIPAPKPAGAAYKSPTAPQHPGYFLELGNQPAYRVGPTDTLSGISQKTLGRSTRWDEIYELNKDRLAGHDQLSVGTILRLPPDASQPRLVAAPSTNY
ncbi:MAG: Peptidoglycan-binding LysM [Planctomycetaceae bacterium]|nr:Peptidoglycan-binding LysM [Planctomycetaceae bacterium]